MKLTLYYSPGACSLASHIALEEAGLPYEAVRILTAAGEQRSAEYLAINPRGKVPTLLVDGKPLFENVAIMTFIAAAHPKAGLWPKTTWEQVQALSFMTWLADTVHPAYGHFYRPERYVDDARCVEAVKSGGRRTFGDCLAEIDALVAGKRWAGARHFTVLDAYLLVFYRWGNRAGLPVRALESYTALVERVLARPAVKRVLADEGITME
jgi:glutathione S-transferase